MEQLTRARIRAASTRSRIALRPPLYLVALGAILISFTAALLAARSLGQKTALPDEPFAPMSDFFPGEPASALEQQGFLCTAPYSHEPPPSQSCNLWPETGDFFQVRLVVSQNLITMSEFQIRGSSLRIGDLVRLWGRPESRRVGHQVFMSWFGQRILAQAYSLSGQFSLLLPVRSVYVMDDMANWLRANGNESQNRKE